jgi:hypothetical protein
MVMTRASDRDFCRNQILIALQPLVDHAQDALGAGNRQMTSSCCGVHLINILRVWPRSPQCPPSPVSQRSLSAGGSYDVRVLDRDQAKHLGPQRPDRLRDISTLA